MHEILTGEVSYKANAEGQAEVAKAQGFLAARNARKQREYEEVQQRYEADFRLSVLRGEEPPDPPPEPKPEPAYAMELAGTMTRLIEERTRLMRDLAPQIGRRADAREREIHAEVLRTPVGKLAGLLAEVNSLASTVHGCMGVGPGVTDRDPGLPPPPGSPPVGHRCHNEREDFSTGELVDTAVRGGSLLHVPGRGAFIDLRPDPYWNPDRDQTPDSEQVQQLRRVHEARERGIRVATPARTVKASTVRGA